MNRRIWMWSGLLGWLVLATACGSDSRPEPPLTSPGDPLVKREIPAPRDIPSYEGTVTLNSDFSQLDVDVKLSGSGSDGFFRVPAAYIAGGFDSLEVEGSMAHSLDPAVFETPSPSGGEMHFHYTLAITDEPGPFMATKDQTVLSGFLPYPLDHYDPNSLPQPYGDLPHGPLFEADLVVTMPAGAPPALTGGMTNYTESGTSQTFTWVTGPVRELALVAAADSVYGGGPVRVWLPRRYSDRLDEMAALTEHTMGIFAELYGVYPYTELDLTFPVFPTALGMEFPGLIIIREDMLEPGTMIGSYPAAVLLEATVVHEIAHQWFYSYVGNDATGQPWIDEGMAQYLTYRYFVERYGRYAAQGFLDSLYGRWQRVDSEPMSFLNPASAYDQTAYGAIVYGRAPLFLIALYERYPDFDEALADLVTEYRWKELDSQGFEDFLTSRYGDDFTAFSKEWLN